MNKRIKRNRKHKKVHSQVYFEGFEYVDDDYNYIDNKNIAIYEEKTDLVLLYIMIVLTIIQILGFMSKQINL